MKIKFSICATASNEWYVDEQRANNTRFRICGSQKNPARDFCGGCPYNDDFGSLPCYDYRTIAICEIDYPLFLLNEAVHKILHERYNKKLDDATCLLLLLDALGSSVAVSSEI